MEIVLIGGGLCGLLTAYRLEQLGYSCQLLEARSTIGGRIRTLQPSGPSRIEMGATWLGDQHTSLLQLLDEFDIAHEPQFMKGTSFYEVSANQPAQEIELPDQGSYRILGGTAVLIEALADRLGAKTILTDQVVREIDLEGKQVLVKTASSVFEADRVVSCLPPQLLMHSVAFSPSMPAAVQEVAEQTHTWMSDSIKVALVYERPFWREAGKAGTLFSNLGPLQEFYDQSDLSREGFALCGFMLSSFRALSKAERQERVLAQLQRVFGPEAGSFLSYTEIDWLKEQYTAISNLPMLFPHQNNGHPIYQQPLFDGRLVLAGSETDPVFGGYMEGAIRAAETAVKIIT